MRETVMAVLCACFLVGCDSNGKVTRPHEADDLLKSYAQRIHVELLPRASELTQEEIFRAVGAIAAEVLVPNRKSLLDKARAELARLPKLTVDTSSGYETVAELEEGSILKALVAEMTRGTSQPATPPANTDAIALAYLWNPRAVAGIVRQRILVGHLGPRDYGKRAMIEGLAPPIVYAISADPQRPVVAIETGLELFIVYLKLTDTGYYVDDKVQWLKRTSMVSQ